ncbi:hypothetical protein HPB51_010964 [Rhipicephalus microplus]|uniref:Uncharacterized protein n=1 Tax=Rhipicephalus microplus TaxID=6941 RepID=A0A9J6DUA3_RHIMP|nr:hypothetical protein HPB51_010964 [Rhipicephalus microplus]
MKVSSLRRQQISESSWERAPQKTSFPERRNLAALEHGERCSARAGSTAGRLLCTSQIRSRALYSPKVRVRERGRNVIPLSGRPAGDDDDHRAHAPFRIGPAREVVTQREKQHHHREQQPEAPAVTAAGRRSPTSWTRAIFRAANRCTRADATAPHWHGASPSTVGRRRHALLLFTRRGLSSRLSSSFEGEEGVTDPSHSTRPSHSDLKRDRCLRDGQSDTCPPRTFAYVCAIFPPLTFRNYGFRGSV